MCSANVLSRAMTLLGGLECRRQQRDFHCRLAHPETPLLDDADGCVLEASFSAASIDRQFLTLRRACCLLMGLHTVVWILGPSAAVNHGSSPLQTVCRRQLPSASVSIDDAQRHQMVVSRFGECESSQRVSLLAITKSVQNRWLRPSHLWK